MVRKTIQEHNGSGSPAGEPVYLTIGFIRRPHGVHGELFMDIHTDFPERLRPGVRVFIGEDHHPMKLASARMHGKAMLISFRGLNTPEDVGGLRNTWVYVTAGDRPSLPKGKVYQHQILGLTVVTDTGQKLGLLESVFETGANKIYVVKTEDDRELLLPAIPEVILGIDLDKRIISVHLIEGLLD